jgi:hypothetical protein
MAVRFRESEPQMVGVCAPELRIFHIDDEWRRWRSIPHHLFDILFDRLSQRDRQNIDIAEFEDIRNIPGSLAMCAFDAVAQREFFSYIFLESASALNKFKLSRFDIVIIDIMSSSTEGLFLSVAEESYEIALAAGALSENCVYFSAYVGELGKTPCDVIGKGDIRSLIKFLLQRRPKSWPS